MEGFSTAEWTNNIKFYLFQLFTAIYWICNNFAYIFFSLSCFAVTTSSFHHQRPRDGYNTFTDGSTTQPPFNSFLNPKWNEPYFDTSVSNNVTALVGKSAYLSCRVRNLGNKTVSERKIVENLKWFFLFIFVAFESLNRYVSVEIRKERRHHRFSKKKSMKSLLVFSINEKKVSFAHEIRQ